MSATKYQLEGLTLAVTNMSQMLLFYSAVFDIQFEVQEMYGSTLYSSRLGSLDLLFCPAEIAQNTAEQNRHQFDILVPDLGNLIKVVTANGGSLMGNISEEDGIRSIGVYDPDHNSIVFIEMKKED